MKSVRPATVYFCLSVVISAGCSTQPATYSDKSSATERDIEATGAAAIKAAKSSTSNYDLSLTPKGNVRSPQKGEAGTTIGNYVVYKNGVRDHRAELRLMQQSMQYRKPGYGDYAADRWGREFDYRVKRTIDKKIDGWLEDLFD